MQVHKYSCNQEPLSCSLAELAMCSTKTEQTFLKINLLLCSSGKGSQNQQFKIQELNNPGCGGNTSFHLLIFSINC